MKTHKLNLNNRTFDVEILNIVDSKNLVKKP